MAHAAGTTLGSVAGAVSDTVEQAGAQTGALAGTAADTAGDVLDMVLGGDDPAGGVGTLVGMLQDDYDFAIGADTGETVFATVGAVGDAVEDVVDTAAVLGALDTPLLGGDAPHHDLELGGLLGGDGWSDHHG